jgi:integrase
LEVSETRSLRWSNLQLTWKNDTVSTGEVVVGRSKTKAGIGRVVPPTRRACAALGPWLSHFPNAGAEDSYIFPFHRVAIAATNVLPTSTTLNSTDR